MLTYQVIIDKRKGFSYLVYTRHGVAHRVKNPAMIFYDDQGYYYEYGAEKHVKI